MALAAGTTLGPYVIVDRLGAGGMGEVYKARDTRLNRTVAIKVLPPELTRDPAARHRFEREARAVAALSNPHICALYDIGRHDGNDFLVMEFLDGETLADRLARGRLKLNQAIEYGIDIAKALSTAHRAGVIHRDIKPGNIMLTKAGATLLDFGVARIPDLSETRTSTLETAQPLTSAGTILGTLQYMAPEQVEGRSTDTLTDIFAFGAVLYEMVSGHRAFSGDSYAAVAGAIVSTVPEPLIKRDPTVPPTLDHLVQVCLAKDPARRWQSAADILTELEWVHSEQAKPHTPAETQVRSSHWKTALLGFVVVALAAAVVGLWSRRTQSQGSVGPPARFPILLPAGSRLLDRPAISRDGTLIAYTSLDKDGMTRVYLRPIDRLEATALSAAEGGRTPFFSPDGRSLAFFGRGGLKSLPLDGGNPSILPLDGGNRSIKWASENDPGAFRGGSWGDDGRITFALFGVEGLSRVSEIGGAVESLTVPAYDADEVGHLWPEVLPGGRAVVFTTTGRDQTEPYKLCLHSSDQPGHRELISAGRSARYSPSGHLVYAQANSLLAVAFDMQTLQVKGKPLPVVERVAGLRNDASSFFAVSESGTLVYGEGPEMFHQQTAVWIGADGAQTPLKNRSVVSSPNDPYPSPTGEHIAVTMSDGARTELGVFDIARETWNRLTTTAAPDFGPVWTSEPERVIFSSKGRSGTYDLFSVAPDGSTDPELLFSSLYPKFASSWSPATKLLAYVEITDTTRDDIWLLDLSRSSKPDVLLNTRFNEGAPDSSPDGRWIAYDSDESGRQEVYARPVGRAGRKHQISTEGGRRARWSRDGRQLFYINSNNDSLMAARISFSGSEPRVIGTSVRARFPYFGGVVANYGTFLDGRILMVRQEPNTVVVDRLIVVQDWLSKITKPSAR